MSNPGGNVSVGTADILGRIGGLKDDVDLLLQQLSEGEYLSVDIFANKWIHLTQLYSRIQSHMGDRTLMAVGRMIAVMDNFMRCAVIT